MPPPSELLACQSPAKPPGFEEQAARRSRELFVLEGCEEGKWELPPGKHLCRCPGVVGQRAPSPAWGARGIPTVV